MAAVLLPEVVAAAVPEHPEFQAPEEEEAEEAEAVLLLLPIRLGFLRRFLPRSCRRPPPGVERPFLPFVGAILARGAGPLSAAFAKQQSVLCQPEERRIPAPEQQSKA